MRALGVVVLAGCRLNFDSATVDARMVDAADASTDVCALPSTILCDDFSAAPAGPTYGDVQWSGSGGRTGGLIEESATPSTGAGVHWALPGTTSGALYARAYVRVHAGPPFQLFFVMVELNNGLATMGQEKLSADLGADDQFAIGAPYSGGGPASSVALTRDRWTCVELGVVIDPTAGEMHLSVDGAPVADRTNVDTLIPTGFHELLLSASVSDTDPSAVIDFDDLVVARAPIGC